jgi:hypothetical protein
LKLIKTNSPEQNPEGFKAIRKAYDLISNAVSPYDMVTIFPKPAHNEYKKITKDDAIRLIEEKLEIREEKLKIKKETILNELGGF